MSLSSRPFGPVAAALAFATLALTASSSHAAQPADSAKVTLPKPTGPFAVGTSMSVIADPDRREIFTVDPNDHRRLALQVYYPAGQGCSPQPYIPSALAGTMTEMLRTQPGFEHRLNAHGCRNAAPASGSGKLPLILFSHGLGPSHFLYVSLLEDLASRGNIVVAIDHPHGSAATYFSDGTLVRRDTSRWGEGEMGKFLAANEYFRNWAEDARSVLDRVFRNDGTVLPIALGARVDPARVAYFGHSYGGVAALYAAQMDGRIKAAMNLDGGVGGMVDPKGTKWPSRMLTPVAADVPLFVINSETYDDHEGYAGSVRVAQLRGASHMSYSDLIWLRETIGTGNTANPEIKRPLSGAEGISLTRELSSLFLHCAFTQNCADFDKAISAAVVDRPARAVPTKD